MKSFEVKGTFREKKEDKNFSMEFDSLNENTARQKALSTMGSRHKVKRVHVKIDSVKESKEKR